MVHATSWMKRLFTRRFVSTKAMNFTRTFLFDLIIFSPS